MQPLDDAVDAAIAEARADGGVPGMAVAIVDREGLVLERRVGLRDVAAGAPVEPGTLFEIGSIGKSMTAYVLLALEREGRLAVTDPVVRHLPWFRVPRTGGRIELRHLMSHTAGITAGIDHTPEATTQVWRLRSLAPGSAPGRRYHYSNVGYKALGLVIEAVEGEPYREVLRRRVLGPAGMADSAPAINDAMRPRLAVGYVPARDDVAWAPGDPITPATWVPTGTADGSVAATARDLGAWLRFLAIGEPELFARMATPVPARGGIGYGFGLMSREDGGRRLVGHGGGMVGYLAGLWWDPAAGLGAVVLQTGHGGAPNRLTRRLIALARAAREGRDPRREPEEPLPAPSPAAGAPAPAGPVPVPRPVDAVAPSLFAGTYRSHDPWTPGFRVESRADGLWLVFPSAPDGFDDEQPLVPMARGRFRVGADRLGPERLWFDLVIDGRAHRAWLSGWDFQREDA